MYRSTVCNRANLESAPLFIGSEQISSWWYIHTMELDSALKMKTSTTHSNMAEAPKLCVEWEKKSDTEKSVLCDSADIKFQTSPCY